MSRPTRFSRTAFLTWENDRLSIFMEYPLKLQLSLLWPDEKETLRNFLIKEEIKKCYLFLAPAEQKLDFELLLQGTPWGDLFRFLKARWRILKCQSLVWWMRPFISNHRELTILSIRSSPTLTALLKILGAHSLFKIYSLSLRCAFKARDWAQKQGGSLAPETLTLVVHPQMWMFGFSFFEEKS